MQTVPKESSRICWNVISRCGFEETGNVRRRQTRSSLTAKLTDDWYIMLIARRSKKHNAIPLETVSFNNMM